MSNPFPSYGQPSSPFPKYEGAAKAGPNPFPEYGDEGAGVLDRVGDSFVRAGERAAESFKEIKGERLGVDDFGGMTRTLLDQGGLVAAASGPIAGVADMGVTALEALGGAAQAGISGGSSLFADANKGLGITEGLRKVGDATGVDFFNELADRTFTDDPKRIERDMTLLAESAGVIAGIAPPTALARRLAKRAARQSADNPLEAAPVTAPEAPPTPELRPVRAAEGPIDESPISSQLQFPRRVQTASGRGVNVSGPLDLVGFIRQQGGLKDHAGELVARGFHNKARDVDFAKNENFIGPVAHKDGIAFDEAALRAYEAGFFSERPSINEFLDALTDTFDGTGRLYRDQDLNDLALLEQIRAVHLEADRLGVDTRGLSERQIIERLDSMRDGPKPIIESDLDQMAPPMGRPAMGIERQIPEGSLQSEVGALTDETRLAREAALPEKAETTGRQKWADRVIDRIHQAGASKLTPLGNVPDEQNYLALRYRTMGKIARVDEIGEGIQSVFAAAPKIERDRVYSFLTTKDADPEIIGNPALRAQAVEVKEAIDLVGQELVRRGKLSQEAYEAHKGEYLPRVYLKHVLDQDHPAGAKIKQSDQGYLKQRQNIPKEIRELMGEIEDPGFLAAQGIALPTRDIIVSDFLREVARNSGWVNPASVIEWKGSPVSTRWLRQEANGLRRRASVTDDGDVRTRMLQEADAADRAIEALADAGVGDPEDYARIPDSARYGDLAGLELRKELHNDIVGAVNAGAGEQGVIERFMSGRGALGKMHRTWKMSKTVFNLPTHFRNMASNTILLNLAGVPLHRMPRELAGAANDILSNGPAFQIAKEYGITAGTFTTQELTRFKQYILPSESKGGFLGTLETAARVSATKAGQAANKMADIYQGEEVLFKTAYIRNALREGKTPVEAAMGAQEAMFDYSLVPQSVQYLRSNPISGSPFITFMYKSTGRLAETAIRHPERYLPYVALPYAVSKLAEENNDLTPEDVAQIRRDLPEWMETKGSLYMMPMKDENGRWQFIDFGYMLPWGGLQQMANGAAQGDAEELFRSTGLFGTPATDLVTALRTNIDPFTRREIVNEFDPPNKQMADMLNYTWRMAAPTFITDIGAVGKMSDALQHDVDRYGNPNQTVPQAAGRFLGINTYPVDQELSRERRSARMAYEIRQTQARLRTVMRDQRLTEEDREQLRTEYVEQIRRLQEEQTSFLDPLPGQGAR